MEYSLQGQEISRICFDYSVVLETIDGTELRIESPFNLFAAESMPPDEVLPDLLRETGSVVVRLLNVKITEASIRESGELSLRFASGQYLQCLPDDGFEAWTLVAATGERAVCMPGGGVSYWPASHPAWGD
ncbi:DUF6188 family protein [Arthrobacter sp. STN4]|uniref:DUF6188 family protein n=1 Tax=Arthrobacter sp. STN4 TaxID=2923276 RepID=UPI0035BFBF7D